MENPDPRPAMRPVSYEADRRLTVVETRLLMHIEQCDKRWATVAKLLWYVVAATTAAFGALLKMALHL